MVPIHIGGNRHKVTQYVKLQRFKHPIFWFSLLRYMNIVHEHLVNAIYSREKKENHQHQ